MLQAIITSELIKIIRAEVTTNILSGISAHVDASVIGGGNERYEGDYEIIPTFETQVLDTAHKVLKDDISVSPIPVERFINQWGGETVIIG